MTAIIWLPGVLLLGTLWAVDWFRSKDDRVDEKPNKRHKATLLLSRYATAFSLIGLSLLLMLDLLSGKEILVNQLPFEQLRIAILLAAIIGLYASTICILCSYQRSKAFVNFMTILAALGVLVFWTFFALSRLVIATY
ncbi:MAG: hypothetical protein RIB44_10445 [Lacipirellulaceae bacterium]